MVAYSFAPQFIEPVTTLAKRQTVRAYRKRHARPSEPIQLYTAMRTRQCRIDGIWLSREEVEAFAIADGFGGSPAMADFWLHHHGPTVFHGVVIRWEPR